MLFGFGIDFQYEFVAWGKSDSDMKCGVYMISDCLPNSPISG